jgi:hypothetical protein
MDGADEDKRLQGGGIDGRWVVGDKAVGTPARPQVDSRQGWCGGVRGEHGGAGGQAAQEQRRR